MSLGKRKHKSEHSGAKNGGGHWGTREEAKRTAKKTRRSADKEVLKKELRQLTRGKPIYCLVCPTWEIKIPERCSNTIKEKSKTLYFCTKRCKERFLKAPEKFK